MKGYKVVNYSVWESLPEIFNSVKEAEEKAKDWKYFKGSVVEAFDSSKKSPKVVKYLK